MVHPNRGLDTGGLLNLCHKWITKRGKLNARKCGVIITQRSVLRKPSPLTAANCNSPMTNCNPSTQGDFTRKKALPFVEWIKAGLVD